MMVKKGRVTHEPQEAHTAGAYHHFRSIKQLRVLPLGTPPLDGMLVDCWVTPNSVSPVPIFYTPGWREIN